MKFIKQLAGALAVIIVCAVGIGFKFASTVHSAPPNSLSSVAHDSSLQGTGTSASPLGVAAGGIQTGHLAAGTVTLPKLGVAGSPTTGTVLGYDGTGLAWQPPGVGGVRVVDSVGHSYPYEVNGHSAVLQTQVATFIVPLAANDFFPNCCIPVYYTSSDCSASGQVYYGVTGIDPNALTTGPVMIDSGVIYYSTASGQIVNFNSRGDLSHTWCTVGSGTVYGAWSSYSTLSLSTYLVPPFRLQVN